VRRPFLLLAALVFAGCGGEDGGKATVWITRDQGAHVLLQRQVPSGLTAMQALDRVADIDTRYGGRFVQAIDGVQGSLDAQRDWFWFVNGYEGDRSAAEYRLHDGDVEWWDFRSWKTKMHQPVVVGAFPEPFLHGYDGKRRPAWILYRDRRDHRAAEKLAGILQGRATDDKDALGRSRVNVLVLSSSSPGGRRYLRARQTSGRRPGDPVRFTFGGDPKLLLRDPPFGRFRYQVNP
jgi:Domain of unknown function (DUF4430)